MDLALWIVQGLLAVANLAAGAMKLVRSREDLLPQMGWVEDVTAGRLRLIGAAELAAALGLVLPGVTGIAPVLTPLAAVGLVVIMVLAAILHARRGESREITINVVIGGLAAFVVWGRLVAMPLG